MKISKIQQLKKIAILWFWREGKATLDFLEKLWCEDITILDKVEIADEYSEKYICISWDLYLENLDSFDLIIKSVWISPYRNPELWDTSGQITTATEIFFSNYRGKVIWITWTKGKSTTSSLCAHVLQWLGYKTALLWNIGTPPLDFIEKDHDYIVYEMSSYMLENFQPQLEVGVLINIFVDHLDWYDWNFELYKSWKQNILQNAKKKIINHSISATIASEYSKNSIRYNERDKDINFHEGSFYIWERAIFTHEWIHLEWEHNMENVTCVLSILRSLDIDLHDIKKILTNFCALPHRLQDLWFYHGIRFIDDSISTTPESTIEALKTYKNNISTLFLGGSDRGYSFETLIKYVNDYEIKNIVLFPESGNKIEKLLDSSTNVLKTKSMQEAVIFAYKYTEKSTICLLSTASPSYSLWKNFEEQWEEFKHYIKTTHLSDMQ